MLLASTPSPGPSPLGITLPRPSWVRLNRLRTGVGQFRSTMQKWGLVPLANCRCGAKKQTADHILASCPLYHPPNGTLGLAALDDDTVNWLKRTALKIWWQGRPKQRRRSAQRFRNLPSLQRIVEIRKGHQILKYASNLQAASTWS